MDNPLAQPGELVELGSTTAARADDQTNPLVKTQRVEIIQLLIPAESGVPTYEAAGEIIIHCLEGRVRVEALNDSRELRASQLLYLGLNEPFSISGIEDASVLVTIIAERHGEKRELIGEVGIT
jgi:quercetin dioxygenase-like cupin family protein